MKPKYNKYFLGGAIDAGQQFVQDNQEAISQGMDQARDLRGKLREFGRKRPGLVKGLGAIGGALLTGGLGGGAMAMNLIDAIRRKRGTLGNQTGSAQAHRKVNYQDPGTPNTGVKPSFGKGGVVKYRGGGMIYAQDSDILQGEKEKNGTAGPRNLKDLLSSLEAVDVPEDYTEQEIIDVRGRNRFVGGEPGSEAFRKYGYALDEDENVAQPMEFRVISERGKRPGGSHAGSGRGYVDFDIQNVELGGVNEETGDVIPNRITIPADVYDMIEEGELSMNDVTAALSPYYSRSAVAGVRTRPQIVRGPEPEEEEGGRKGNPPRNRGRKINFDLPEIRFPQLPYPTSPKYAGGPRPIFKKGQLGRVGRGS